jgi:hypothetical protein
VEKHGDRVLVAACYNHGGLFAEIPNGVEESSQSETLNLGAIILETLSKCVYQEEFDYSTQHAKDCPAYIASGLKTVTSFEQQFLRYTIQGENESNHFYRVTSPRLCNDIELSLVFKASEFDFQIGLDVMKLHRFYLEAEKML